MRSLLLTVLCLLVSYASSLDYDRDYDRDREERETLKCFSCVDCGYDTGSPSICPKDKDVCMKLVVGSHIVRRCGQVELCGMGSIERATNRAWAAITNAFKDVVSEPELLYCCNDDYCNGSTTFGQNLGLMLSLLLLTIGFNL